MKTRHYKTLKGMVSQTLYHTINFNDFKSGYLYHAGRREFMKFTLPESEIEKAYEMFASVIYANGKANAYKLANYDGKGYGILERLTIICKSYGFHGDYIAGQDYGSEIRLIQKIFRS